MLQKQILQNAKEEQYGKFKQYLTSLKETVKHYKEQTVQEGTNMAYKMSNLRPFHCIHTVP